MFNTIKKKTKGTYYLSGAAMTVGMMGVSNSASAQTNDFGTMAENIVQSTSSLPGMISGVSYLVGSLLAVLGVMKIKDHVEKPDNTPLKEGAIRLTAGGALFALPLVAEVMQGSVLGDDTGAMVAQQEAAIDQVDTGTFFPGNN